MPPSATSSTARTRGRKASTTAQLFGHLADEERHAIEDLKRCLRDHIDEM